MVPTEAMLNNRTNNTVNNKALTETVCGSVYCSPITSHTPNKQGLNGHTHEVEDNMEGYQLNIKSQAFTVWKCFMFIK